jgi:hypothetical protein
MKEFPIRKRGEKKYCSVAAPNIQQSLLQVLRQAKYKVGVAMIKKREGEEACIRYWYE